MNVFRVGVITRTHGVKGAVKVYPTTDDPKRFQLLKQLRFGWTEQEEDIRESYEIERVQFFKNQVILKLKGINTPEEAEKLRGGSLWIPDEEALPLKENEYYLRDFLDAEVVTEEEEPIGRVEDILETGSNEVLVVRTPARKEILIPVIRDCIIRMDAAGHRVIARLLKGMTE